MKLLILFSLAACTAFKPAKKELFNLRLLHTNDHHGHYLPDSKGQYGMAARKTLVDRLRKENYQGEGYSLLLSGGDINTGTMESDMFDAKPDFLGMKYIGYDAMAVGNHEFDNSFEVIQQQQKWAGFPFLSANIFYKGTDKLVFNPRYIIRQYKGFKIGIFGLTTIDTPFKASNQKIRGQFEFRNIIDVSKNVVAELKSKVDMIIAITHVGHQGSLTANGDIKLAQAVDGIDVIIGGHSQEVVKAEIHNDTIIVQAEDWGKYVGSLDIRIYADKTFDLVNDHNYHLHPVNHMRRVGDRYQKKGNHLEPDRVLSELFIAYKYEADQKGKELIGKIDKALVGDRVLVRTSQQAIGQFFGQAILHKDKSIDGVLLNSGAIRSGLEPGKITWKDLHRLHPYGNTICTVSLSAEEFFNYVAKVTGDNFNQPAPQGSYPQLINMRLTFSAGKLVEIKGPDWKITKANNKIIGTKKRYVLGTMNFLATGGDNYPVVADKPSYVDSGFMINSAMKEYVEAKKSIRVSDFVKLSQGRIIKK